ncbi:MAG: hypothetical protein FJZ58_08235 [Chlamydiae bacterium]|nr:hypothetical protein [Chlamydiota bacterium]
MRYQLNKAVFGIVALCCSLTVHAEENASINIPNRNGMGPFVTLDALLWKAHQNNLEFALKSSSETDVQLYIGPESSPHFHYDWGFRFGLGYDIKQHDDWDIYTNWTHFKTDAHRTITAASEHALQAILTSAYGGSYFIEQASSQWNLKLNLIDLGLGKQYCISRFFSVHGFAGLENAWIHQSNYINYTGGQLEENGKSPTHVDFKNNFWGLGILVGVEALWKMGAGLSLYANGTASLLSGFFSLNSKETIPNAVNNNVSDRFRSETSMFNLALGIRWDKTLCNERYHIALQTGWEQLLFPSQYQWQAQDTPPYTNTDLSMTGWTLATQFHF